MVDSIGKMRREIARLGWRTERTSGGHLRCSHPRAAYYIYAASTPVRSSGLEEFAVFDEAGTGVRGAGGDSSARIIT